MTRIEKEWSEHLAAELAAGRICAWWYEPLSLRLAKGAHYKPDFMVQDADGFIEIHETKGYMQEAAAIRLKVAATNFPLFKFKLITKRLVRDGGGYEVKEIGAAL